MFDFFDSVTSFFDTIWSFMTNTVSSFFTLFSVISSTGTLTTVLPMLLPSFIATSLIIVVSIGVLKLILSLLPF